MRAENSTHHHWPTLLAVIAVLLLAAGFYLVQNNRVSFWQDESWMAVAIDGGLGRVWTFSAEQGIHPPLYFYLGWGYVRLVGESEVALRWLAGMCGVVGLAFTYRLGADLFDRRAGVLAALTGSGSLFLIYFGRLARQYTLLFALAVSIVWAYHRWQRHPERRRWLLAIIALQTALLYTHYFGAWMAVVIGLHGLLILSWRHRVELLGSLALAGVLFVPWLPSLLYQMSTSQGGISYAITDTGQALIAYTDRLFNGAYLLSIILLALGGVAVWRHKRWRSGALLLIWLVVPLALTLLLNPSIKWFIERNMLFSLGGAFILFGAGLGWIAARGRLGMLLAFGGGAAFVVLGVVNYPTFWPYITPDWRSAAAAIAQDSRPDDLFVVSGEPFSMTYYLRRHMDSPSPVIGMAAWLDHADPPDRVWLTGSASYVPEEAIAALPPHMQQTRRYGVGVVVTEFYQRLPAETITVFGDQIALGAAQDLTALTLHPGQAWTLDLWWRALAPPDLDYSVGVYLVAADGAVISQHNGGFDRGRVNAPQLPLNRWTPDARVLDIPADAPPGTYTMLVGVYDWRDGKRLVPANGRDDDLYVLTTVEIVEP